jgi:4'-phosphopantetheinyl transferase EntD
LIPKTHVAHHFTLVFL